MAARLLSEGIAGTEDKPLVVWNRSQEKCTALQSKFPDKKIEICDTAAAVVQACKVTYSMLSTPEASKAVFDKEGGGVLAGVSEGKCLVDCATLAEADMQRMNEAVTGKGGYVMHNRLGQCLTRLFRKFLEAPVSGSKVPAATGTLIFLCAGSQELFDEIKDNGLNAMGKASHFFGSEVGSGTKAKLVVNSLMGTMLAAFGEGLALSESMGLDPLKMIEVIGQGAIASPVYALKGPKMVAKDHAPHFPLKHAHKDMALASEMAKRNKVEYSIMDKAEELFRAAREDKSLDVADNDFSAVYEKIHDLSQSDFSAKRMKKE